MSTTVTLKSYFSDVIDILTSDHPDLSSKIEKNRAIFEQGENAVRDYANLIYDIFTPDGGDADEGPVLDGIGHALRFHGRRPHKELSLMTDIELEFHKLYPTLVYKLYFDKQEYTDTFVNAFDFANIYLS